MARANSANAPGEGPSRSTVAGPRRGRSRVSRRVVGPMEGAARQKWTLTQEAFDGLLATLGPDRNSAAERYLDIRRNLVRLFEWRCWPLPPHPPHSTTIPSPHTIAT